MGQLLIATERLPGYRLAVSTLIEIQDAVARLPDDQKRALSLWLDSQVTPTLSAAEEQVLLRSLDDAICDVDAGRGVSAQTAHELVASWAAR